MESPLSILQITDLHLLTKLGEKMCNVDTEQSFCNVLKYAFSKHKQFDLILVTGDLVQDPSHFGYQRIHQELEKYKTRTVCLPGNHDDIALMQKLIQSEKVNCNKNNLFKHWQIICLNSKKDGTQGGFIDSTELEFLSKSLNLHSHLNTLIAIHHNSIPTGSRWLDTMTIENSDEFFSIISKYPQVKAITCGHIHQKQELKKNNRLILGAPSTCFQFKPDSVKYALDDKSPGYRVLELFSNGDINSEIYYLPQ
ncbi:MAG: 3',5'-cyclic-AMP phosphodiesterase [Methylococcales bacterium]|nr:3',5'-cyclic-AMP phosphodiesterase [Methylococcales bacterium]